MRANKPDPERQLQLLRQYREDGNERARDELVAELLPWVRRVAGRYSNRGLDQEDLVQIASVGLVKAIDRFDFDRGVRLTTFAEPTVTGEIKRHFRDHGWTVRPPRDLQELNAEVMRAIDSMTNDLKRSPTVPEVAVFLKTTEDAVLEAIHAGSGYKAASLDLPEEEGGGFEQPALAVEDRELALADDRTALSTALEALSARDAQVVKMHFFRDMTQSEIADEIGVSQMQVSRILRGALMTLREEIEREGPANV
ncbi:MAG: SigB/SigF/SigG family RNA polymerase sigma factor [Solirubrobacterales bacterium]